ncbi:MAG: ABC transporter permease [Dermabacter sp.]|nr:ABC transporter permease [Dermabacter sp.]
MNEARLGPRAQVVLMVALVAVLTIGLSAMAPNTFPTLLNAQSMMGQIAPLGIFALCIGLTFLIGGIDLSIVAVANTAAITAALVGSALAPVLGGAGASAVGVLAALVVGLAAGAINGFLVSRLRVHPIPITLGTMSIYTGIGMGITKGATVYGTGDLGALSEMTVIMMPLSFVVFLLLVGAFAVLTMKTRLGFQMYAVGESAKVARFARLPVDRITMLVYCCSGTLAAVAGLLMFSSTNSANVSFASSYLMQAILIAVVAGIDPYGGAGRMWMIIIGAVAMQELQTGINMVLGTWSGSSFAANFVWGLLLIAVLGLSRWMSTRTRRVRAETIEAQLAPT